MNWKDALKLMASAIVPALVKLMFVVVIGTLLNWIFLVVMSFRFLDTFNNPTNSFLQLLPSLLLFIFFIIGFPFLYFLVGKSYAIKSALKSIFQKNAPALFDYLVPKAVETIESYQHNETIVKTTNLSTNFISKIKNMPWFVRLLYRQLLKKIPFKSTFDSITENIELTEENYPSISQRLSEQLSSAIEQEFLDISLKSFFLLLLLNVVTMVVCAVFVL